MLIPNHPNDERLSALASGDPEATADVALSEHVASCIRCTDTVAELGALRASLAELPDLHPHRPLRLLPPVDEPAPSRVDAVGGWARRFFAPMLTAGAALALVGLVGTTVPILGSGASGGQLDSVALEGAQPSDNASRGTSNAGAGGEASDGAAAELDNGSEATPSGGEPAPAVQPLHSNAGAPTVANNSGGYDLGSISTSDERPIWPMLLFAGIAIMIAAALLRWILAPRAG